MTIIGWPWMRIEPQFCDCKNQLELKFRFVDNGLPPLYNGENYWECPKCGKEFDLLVDKETRIGHACRKKKE